MDINVYSIASVFLNNTKIALINTILLHLYDFEYFLIFDSIRYYGCCVIAFQPP